MALGGFANFRSLVDSSMATCGFEVKQITGSPNASRRDVYANTNPFDLSPNGSATTFINGDHDSIVPSDQSARDAARVRKRGDSAETLTLPGATATLRMAAAARRGLRLRAKFDRVGTQVGVDRAHQLAGRESLDDADVKSMHSYFARHGIDKDTHTHEWGSDKDPSAGFIARLLWGGGCWQGLG